MYSKKIKLRSINDTISFLKEVNTLDFNVDLQSGNYKVNAKSIMGVLSLDLINEVNLIAHTTDENNINKIDKIITKCNLVSNAI